MRKYLRFVGGMHGYFGDRTEPEVALERAREALRERIERRDQNFLSFVERGIFGYPRSPYLPLLEATKIDFPWLERHVRTEGIEGTLRLLRDEGVYFTVDEFKGKCDVERHGLRFRCAEEDFDNPFLSTAYEVRSGATRSSGTRVRIDFDYLRQRSMSDAFLLDEHGVLTAPIANWFPLFPGAPGINSTLRFSYIGNPPKKWFSQVAKPRVKVNWEKRWGTELIFAMGRLHRVPMARPEFVDLNHAEIVARWANDVLEEHPACVVYTFATSAVRVCTAARDAGLNLDGVRFLVTGEPLTQQKRREIEAVGAVPVPVYGISEAGVIAAGGSHAYPESDHCYLYKDTTAVVTHEHRVEHSDMTVDSFLFTTLLHESPKLLLNVGMGDYGSVYEQRDDSEFGKLGFDTHIASIRSYEKLTGEGVTFVDTDFVTIIEKRLPELFGGASTDYQLIEEEDEKGMAHLKLLVSPKVAAADDQAVVATFLSLLRDSEDSPESWAASGIDMWDQAGTVRVVREYPQATRSGKILPFHVVR
jgi:hypothetical protein